MPSLKCTLCNKAPTPNAQHKKCSMCKASVYCSIDCQREDWRTHKLVCEQFKAFETQHPRPSTACKLAILLPVDEDNPKLIWLPTEREEGYSDFETAQVMEFLGSNTMAEHVIASARLARSKPGQQRYNLDDTTVIFIRESGGIYGSCSNQSVIHMMKGKNRHDWKGPMIIASQPGTSIDPMFYKDVTPTSFRVAADFSKWFGSGSDNSGPTLISGEAAMQRLLPAKPKGMVQGVQIASKGDVILHGKIKFTEVQTPLGHPIFNIEPTEISKYMGIPLLVMKVGGYAKEDMEKGDKMGFSAFQNRTALFLNMEADTHGHRWGWADFLEWNKMIGTVLVVRQDKKALTVPQVEALAKFCRFELCPAMGELSESFYPASGEKIDQKHIQKAKEEFVKTQMSKEAFEEYFFTLKKQRVDMGVGTWEHALSPYAL